MVALLSRFTAPQTLFANMFISAKGSHQLSGRGPESLVNGTGTLLLHLTRSCQSSMVQARARDIPASTCFNLIWGSGTVRSCSLCTCCLHEIYRVCREENVPVYQGRLRWRLIGFLLSGENVPTLPRRRCSSLSGKVKARWRLIGCSIVEVHK